MTKKLLASCSLAIFLLAATPRPARADTGDAILIGALVGAVIGGVVGAVIYMSRSKPAPAQTTPSGGAPTAPAHAGVDLRPISFDLAAATSDSAPRGDALGTWRF